MLDLGVPVAMAFLEVGVRRVDLVDQHR